jgi:predicted transcriptional regulator
VSEAENNSDLLEMTSDIVSAFASNNQVATGDLPDLIRSVHATLTGLSTGEAAMPEAAPAEPLVPAVPIKKSVTPDAIICLEDGKPFKTLKRHLMTAYGMTPAEYREKWNLPKDYPMVAPNYSAQRAATAKKIGLGRKPSK